MYDLKTLRTKAGKTMVEVAEAANITKQRYHYVESFGGIECTSEETARKIASALGVNLFQIVDEGVLKFKPRTKKERDLLIRLIRELEISDGK